MGLVIALVLLAIPASHYVFGHNAHRRILRVVMRRGPEVPVTEHERRHAARPPRARLLADAGWAAYMAGVLAVALTMH